MKDRKRKGSRRSAKGAASAATAPRAKDLAKAKAVVRDARTRLATAEARERLADARERLAAARERSADERTAHADLREQSLAERLALVEGRERAAAERDAVANERDRAASDRDTLANDRDRALAEREARLAGVFSERSTAPFTDDEHELERARLEAELQRAHLDSLTGALRREMGRLALRNEIERARRGDGRFVIAFIDVDGLKAVNDRDGHAAGDRVLRTLAATMRANLRAYDPIVRYGGDEFLCGISSIDTTEVQHRLGVIDQSLRHATGVGISAGLATLTGGETLEELTEKADAALLEAKRGRPN